MILPIIQAPDARLLRSSFPVQELAAGLGDLFGALMDTRIAHKGAGLSAVQIGVHLRVVAVAPAWFRGFRLMINPEIVRRAGDVESIEGCLSIDGGIPRFRLRRAREVTVKFLDLTAEERQVDLDGFAAAIAQHEIDHLNGKLLAPDYRPKPTT